LAVVDLSKISFRTGRSRTRMFGRISLSTSVRTN
jgi:hypothetical protein